jgi:hypothetical protein
VENVLGWLRNEARPHDLHAVLVEDVLDIRVQVRQRAEARFRSIEVNDQLVLRI